MVVCDRDAVSDLALHFLAKMKIMVVKDIEREDIEFICKVCVYQCLEWTITEEIPSAMKRYVGRIGGSICVLCVFQAAFSS